MTIAKSGITLFIDPSSPHFFEDRLFDAANAYLNRDGTLLPFVRLREHCAARGIEVHTADYLRRGEYCTDVNHYWSLGLRSGYRELLGRADVRLRGFVMMEPSLVARSMYADLPELSAQFESICLHNTVGDGYSLNGVRQDRLRTFFWPQPYEQEVEPYWGRTDRVNKLVVVAGHHHPKFRRPEYYTRRIEAVGALAGLGAIDLFGRGWDRWWSKESAWLPYWQHRRALMAAYRGSCDSKLEVVSGYRFCLCFENMPMAGYLSEKLFDCLYAGTVPVYLGAPDIEQLVPSDAFVDMRQFKDFKTMFELISGMPDAEWQRKRNAGREFLRGVGRERYYNSLTHLMGDFGNA